MLYRSGYKYQLAETVILKTRVCPPHDIVSEFIHLYIDGTLIIFSGYAWDGPFGPTIDTRSSMRGSLVHDALYQLIREGKLPGSFRKLADIELRRYLIKDRMLKCRANIWYKSVRKCAGPAADPKHRKKVHEAP